MQVDPTEWDSRHSIRSSGLISGVAPSGSYNTNSLVRVEGVAQRNTASAAMGGVGMRLAWCVSRMQSVLTRAVVCHVGK
jgi:hypothetical protein